MAYFTKKVWRGPFLSLGLSARLNIVIVIAIAGVHSGEVCLQCSSISHPRFCRTVQKCLYGELCYMDEVSDGNQVVYNLGCRPQKICSGSNTGLQAINPAGKRNCTHCCNGDLCNANGCNQKAFQQDRGPVCYTCKAMSNPDGCTHISVCDRDETCLLSTNHMISGGVYTASCQSQAACRAINSLTAAVGKRSTHLQERRDLCQKCCDYDLCNNHCENTGHHHCNPNPCIHGTCILTAAGYSCMCNTGYTGRNCNTGHHHCSPNPCIHGTCTPTAAGYTCVCNVGYIGRNCDSVDVPFGLTSTTVTSTQSATSAITTTDSCKDLTSTLWCETYRKSCWHKTIAYQCPHTCRVPGCPGPTVTPPRTTSSGHCVDTVNNCAFIHSVRPGFCHTSSDYASVHCRQFCRFC